MAWSGARAKMLSSSVSYADHLRSASDAARGDSAAARALKQHERQIDLDLERTFPNHAAFRKRSWDERDPEGNATARGGEKCASTSDAVRRTNAASRGRMTSNGGDDDASRGSKLEPLRRVLLALAHAVPDVGYTQGMNFVCGWCLLVLDKDEGLGSRDVDAAKHALEECAFWLMRAVLQDVLPGYFAPGLAALRFELDALDDEFLAVAPDAHAALEKTGCHLRCFTPRWLLCVMVGTAPAAATLRVWDTLLLDAPGGAFDSNSETSEGAARASAMPSLRFRPRDVLRRCALAMLTEPGRARAIAFAPGAAEAVESIRAAGRGVTDLQAFLRRVRDLAPGARPAGLRAALGSTAVALAAAAAGRRGDRRGGTPRRRLAATSAAATPPRGARRRPPRRRRSRRSAPCSRRCAARPLGSPRSRARCAGASSASAATEAATRAGRLAWRVAGRGAATERRREKENGKRKTASRWTAGAARRRADAASPASTPWPPGRRLPRCAVRCARLPGMDLSRRSRPGHRSRACAEQRRGAARSQTRQAFS